MNPIRIVIASFLLLLTSCQSKDGDFTVFTPSDDLALGKKISAQIANDPANFPILEKSQFPQLYTHLEKIMSEIIQSDDILHKEELAWELKVIHNDTIYNAFCTPGGFIYVYTGLIRFVESEDELAGIIAHEVAHGDLRHSTDQLTKVYGLKLLVSLLIDGDAVMLANLGVNLLGLKFSRGDESEADIYAVRYLSDTPYNPVAFADFFKRLQSKGEDPGIFQFLSTHPDPGNRVEKIEAEWKKQGGKKGSSSTTNFKNLLKALPQKQN